jgi:hypothetical protein
MNSDNNFKKSDWIGQQKAWASAPPALRKIAAQYFLIPQTLEHNLIPSPYLPIAKLLEFTLPLQNTAATALHPTQFFSSDVPDIGDRALMLRSDDPYQGADVYDDCDVPLDVVSSHLFFCQI